MVQPPPFWSSEFVRWLVYGSLFGGFLAGLVRALAELAFLPFLLFLFVGSASACLPGGIPSSLYGHHLFHL